MGAIIEDSVRDGNPLEEMHIGRLEVAIAKCRSVGWLISEDERAIMIAQNVSDLAGDNAQTSGYMRIPKSCIRRRRVLR